MAMHSNLKSRSIPTIALKTELYVIQNAIYVIIFYKL